MACDTIVRRNRKGLSIVRLARMAACVGMVATAIATAAEFDQGMSTNSGNAAATLNFTIAPQPLMAALRAYSEVTGQAVLVDASLTTGRQSPGVVGQFNKVDALQTLLAGTGLVASYSTAQAFTLKLAEQRESAGAPSDQSSDSLADEGVEAVTERYAGKIQRPIEAALCRSELTRPGAYRLALQLWITPSGKVERTRMLSANDDARANEIGRLLDDLVLEPPPSAMQQPLTLLLLPRKPTALRDCGTPAHQRS